MSDADHAVGRAYEVERPAGDRYAAFPERISYLINPGGQIARAYAVSDVAGHADAVLADLARFTAAGRE